MLNQLLNLYPLFVKYEELMKKMCQVLIAHDFMTSIFYHFRWSLPKISNRGENEFKMGEIFFGLWNLCAIVNGGTV